MKASCCGALKECTTANYVCQALHVLDTVGKECYKDIFNGLFSINIRKMHQTPQLTPLLPDFFFVAFFRI